MCATTCLTPRELAAEIPPKMLVGRQDCLHNMLAILLEAGRIAYILCRRPCLPTLNVKIPACLPTFLEGFPPPVREGLSN